MKWLLIAFMFFSSSYSQDLDKNDTYSVIQTLGSVEIRAYKPALFIGYFSNADIGNQSAYFRTLADYIFGNNKKEEKIAMTSPVVIKMPSKNEMLFRLPKGYNTKNAPKPNNKKIKFTTTSFCTKAVITYSGYTNQYKESKKIDELKKTLDQNNIKYTDEFELFVYDPPYQIFNRRNEISVNILNE